MVDLVVVRRPGERLGIGDDFLDIVASHRLPAQIAQNHVFDGYGNLLEVSFVSHMLLLTYGTVNLFSPLLLESQFSSKGIQAVK
jgi:hypothetical protein